MDFLPIKGRVITFERVLAVLLTPYSLWIIFSYRYHFIDNVNIIFHEAGHVILRFFGDTIQFMGGTIFQLLIPTIIMVNFYVKRQKFEAAFCGIWFGENLMNVAVYVADAKKQAIRLIGGTHDWHWLFSRWGLLNQAESIGKFTHVIASAIVIFSLMIVWEKALRPDPAPEEEIF